MDQELTRKDTGEVVKVEITHDQMGLIKNTIAKGASDEELKLFFFDCRRRGVHPLDKLIHFTKRSGKYTPITSIDFMRSRASETGDCAGIDDAIFGGEEGKNGFTATVTVWRHVNGERCGFTSTARWSEYCPGEGMDFLWKKMPFTMLSKCAEALSLRKAFPQQIAGLYSHEEMAQSVPLDPSGQEKKLAPPKRKSQRKEEEKKVEPKNPGAGISFAQKNMLEALINKSESVSRDDVKANFDVEHLTDLTMGQMNDVIDFINTGLVQGEAREPGSDG